MGTGTDKTPLISVIVPCYNQARFLPDCLDSLLAQTYPHWEAIIINDGSTDDTGAVARRYAGKDARFRWLEQENRGPSATRNRGLDHSTGAYIQFLDPDDVVAPDKFELQIGALSAIDGPALAYCDYAYGAEDDLRREIQLRCPGQPRFRMARPIEDIAARWETEFSIPIHCFLFDVRLFRERGIRFNEHLPNHEDWDCWMRIFAMNPRTVHVPGKLALYRVRSSSISRDLRQMRRGFRKAIDAQLELCQADPVLRRILKQKRAEMDADYLKQMRARHLEWWKSWVPWPMQKVLLRLFGFKK